MADAGGMSLGAQAIAAVDSGAVEPGGPGGEEAQAPAPAGEEAAAPEEGGGVPDADGIVRPTEEDILAYFQDQDAEQKPSDDDDDDFDDDAEADGGDQQQGGRAQRRIRSLSKRLRAAEAAQQQIAAQFQQELASERQRWQAESQRAYLQQREHLVRMQAEMQAMRQYALKQLPQQELSPADRWRQELRDETLGTVRKQLTPEIQQMRQELQAMKQAEQKRIAAAQQARRSDYLNRRADEAVAQAVLRDLDTSVLDATDKHLLGSVAMSISAMEGIPIPEAARRLRVLNQKLSQGVIKYRTSQNGAKTGAGKQVPQPQPHGARLAKGDPVPSLAEARKQGYKNPLEAMIAADRARGG